MLFKLLFFGIAGYIVYNRWIRPRALAQQQSLQNDDEFDDYVQYEDISDE